MARPSPFVRLALLLLCMSACTNERGLAPECGAPGTGTVVRADGCGCLPEYMATPSRDGCVLRAQADGGSADAGTAVDAAVGDVMPSDTGIDTGPPAPGTVREVDTSLTDCNSACAEQGFPCTTTCEEGPGWATYGYIDWDYGWYRSVHSESFATCEEGPPFSEYREAGETYELGSAYCCCEVPEVSVRSGNVSAPETCDAICAGEGMECADFHKWSGEDTNGGLLATYYRAATGSVTDVVMGCGAVPPPSRRIANADRTLRDYDCACY